jgi:hypothetical protein
MQPSTRFIALANKNLRRFLTGQAISLTGTWMQSVAQGWLVYTLTKSRTLTGPGGSSPVCTGTALLAVWRCHC